MIYIYIYRKYYDDCAQILTEHMLAMLKPGQLIGFSTLDPLVTQVDDIDVSEPYVNPLKRVARMLRNKGGAGSNGNESDGEGSATRSLGQMSTGVLSLDADPTLLEEGAVPVRDLPRELISEPASLSGSRDGSEDNLIYRSSSQKKMGRTTSRVSLCVHQEELRCVIAVVRHGDRTPKEKLKLNTKEPIILQYFIDQSANKDDCAKDLKVKAKGPMILFLGAVIEIVEKYEAKIASSDRKDDDEETIANNKLLWKFKHMVRYDIYLYI